jgi:hypothetical protein
VKEGIRKRNKPKEGRVSLQGTKKQGRENAGNRGTEETE